MRASLILGGARSGKSARALALATAAPRTFVATAEPLDAEMAERIARHKAERGADRGAERGAGWRLIEAPLELAPAIARHREGSLVVDCLTLWLSNLMHAGRDPAAETGCLLDALRGCGRAILVSNEVGLSIAPENALARAFRDEQGRLNQRVAAAADHVEFVAAGLPLLLKGAP
jgi:adenosylcobinamide kinase / adenosylcobinamide-phosphate guanylyltransferase